MAFKGIRSLLGKIPSLLRRKPAPPKIDRLAPAGHRGVGARRLKPNEWQAWDRTEEEQRLPITQGEKHDFLYDHQPLMVNSSNVEAAQYVPEKETMIVKFLGDGFYAYRNVAPWEAATFVTAQSKGGYVWDYFRVRGSKTAHKKPYSKVAGWWDAEAPTNPAKIGKPTKQEVNKTLAELEAKLDRKKAKTIAELEASLKKREETLKEALRKRTF